VTAHTYDMLFVMDPVESLDIRADTTFVLMLEAQRRGHRVFSLDPADLGVAGGKAVGRARRVTVRPEEGNHADVGPPEHLVLDDLDVVWQRKDPPVDADYVTATQILRLCRRALVLNRPEGILAANEKLYSLLFADLMPETLVAREIPRFLDFMAERGGEMIVKPLDGKGGEGIFHLRQDDRNLFSILEQSTAFGTKWAMAQRYMPEIREGDKRILLLEGEPLGALLRVPAQDETRANLHVGGRAAKAAITLEDRRIIDRIRPWLERDGLFFVGIDVIGDRLTEINLTSPTGIQEMNALDSARYEERVLQRVEQRLQENPGRS